VILEKRFIFFILLDPFIFDMSDDPQIPPSQINDPSLVLQRIFVAYGGNLADYESHFKRLWDKRFRSVMHNFVDVIIPPEGRGGGRGSVGSQEAKGFASGMGRGS